MTAEPHGLRKLWQQAWPDNCRPGPLAFSPAGDRVALGSAFQLGIDGDSVGALTVYDAGDGSVVHQTADGWVVGPLAFTPDGRQLATAEVRCTENGQAMSQRIRVIDADTFAERAAHPVDFHNQTPIFSPDGRLLVVGGFPLSVLDVMTGTERWAGQDVSVLDWSPDGTSLAGGAIQDGSAALAVLDAADGTPRHVTPAPGTVDALAYRPDGAGIVAGGKSAPGCVIWASDAATGERSWVTRDEDLALVKSIAVSTDGRWAAVYGLTHDGGATLAVHDLVGGTPRFPPLRLDVGPVPDLGSVRYSPTLRHVVVQGGSNSHGVLVIDARTGIEYARTGPDDECCAVAPDGGSIVAGLRTNPFQFAGAVERDDLGLQLCRHAPGGTPTVLAMPPGGTPLVAVADTNSAVTVLDATSGARLAARPVPGTVTSLVFADHGQAVAAGGSDGVRLFSIVGTRSWKVDTIGAVNALAVSGEAGAWIATAAGRTVRSLSSADGTGRWPSPSTHPQTVTRVAAAGNTIATGCVDRKTRILDAATGTETFSVEGDGRVEDLAFTADGALLATANADGTVVLIDVAGASERGRLTRPFACTRITLSSDGALLAAAWDDNTVSIYDITGAGPPPKLRELTFAAPVSGLEFNPAEHTVAIAAEGASVVLYDTHDGTELVRILQPAVSRFTFGADGTLIATAGDDDVVRVWTSGVSVP